LGVSRLSTEQYQLKLRVGGVPVSELVAAGLRVSVAKFRLAGDDVLAMFRGDGLAIAENWVKSPESRHQFAEGEGTADLSGLSCRWEPFRPEKGKILALLVKSRTADEAGLYRQVFEEVTRLAGGEQPAANPIKLEKMKKDRTIPSTFGLENKLYAQRSLVGKAFAWSKNLFEIVVGNLMFRFRLRAPSFDAPGYLVSTIQRSDFRKFDGMLRMVIEVPNDSRAAVEKLLEQLRAEGHIFYGYHWSDEAIMTCALFSMSENRHLHFIDGGDGGYAFAAVGLKAQMAAALRAAG
jgi:hypothetical protein